MRFSIGALMLSAGLLVSATDPTNCCGEDGEDCCSRFQPSIKGLAERYHIVYDEATCCPADSAEDGCAPYSLGGCRLCKVDCEGEDNCVTCSPSGTLAPAATSTTAPDFSTPAEPIRTNSGEENTRKFEASFHTRTTDRNGNDAVSNSGKNWNDDLGWAKPANTWNDDMNWIFSDSHSHSSDKVVSSYINKWWEEVMDWDVEWSYDLSYGSYDLSYGFYDQYSAYVQNGGRHRGRGSFGGGSFGGGGSGHDFNYWSDDHDDPLHGQNGDRSSGSRSYGGSSSGISSGSYGGFSEDSEDSECSTCYTMTALEQRLLNERSRSLVCDSTCLTSSGHDEYGVNMCNYFNAGLECRACCHTGSIFSGCMPCEESCNLCNNKVIALCEEDPCGEKCEAYICCTQGWSDNAGCDEMVELADEITLQCGTLWTCEAPDLSCSDLPEMCVAKGDFGRNIESVDHGTCPKIDLQGGGDFDNRYVLKGALDGELVFWSYRDDVLKPYVLQSVSMNICAAHVETSLTYGGVNMESIFASSRSGTLAWGNGPGEISSDGTGSMGGCTRHVWYFKDMSGAAEYVYIAVDPSEHPRNITSDWIKVPSAGEIMQAELELSCAEQSTDSYND